MKNEIQFSFTWKASMFGGRKLVEYFTIIFLNGYNEILFYNGKREKRGEIMEKREKKKVGEASTVARERWLINSPFFLESFIL